MGSKLMPGQRAFLTADPNRRAELRYIIEAQNIPPNFCADEVKLSEYMKASGKICDVNGHVAAGIVRREDGAFREAYSGADGSYVFYMNAPTKLLTLGTGAAGRNAAGKPIPL